MFLWSGSRRPLLISGPLRTGRAGCPRIRLKQAAWASQDSKVVWSVYRRLHGAGTAGTFTIPAKGGGFQPPAVRIR
ncbi:hypothetical protein Scel_28620 [Streptomyces cellostaticus]|nr:hypothetical protein Scel_28620 [Streptomyces cellostaticus]